MHEQHVTLGAPRDCLLDGVAEQSREKASFAAADDDQVRVSPLGDLEQALYRIAKFDDVFALDVPARE